MIRTLSPLALTAALLVANSTPAPAQPKLLSPTNLGKKVNTKFDETDPFLLQDSVRIFYSSNAEGQFDLMVAKRKNVGSPFNEAGLAAGLNMKGFDTRSPFFYQGAKEFYFASNRIPDDAFKDDKNFDITVKPPDGPAYLIQNVNTPVDEMFPWITADGSEFYFSRKLKEGWRLCMTQGPKVGPPDKGKIVNEIPAGFHHATLSPDGLVMYLEGPLDKERTGLFRSTRKKVGDPWEKPRALVNLNHPDAKRGDMAPALSLSGKTLFFASDRPGGEGGLDLYWVTAAELKAE